MEPGRLPITSKSLREGASALVTPELIVFPVRHHSPSCAWQLHKLLQEITPSTVLVEGPRSFSSLIPLLTHAEARMPLAVYAYSVARPSASEPESRRSAFYPFCDYSPELVALRNASSREIPVRFIDLEFSELCQLEDQSIVPGAPVSLLDESHYQRSQYLKRLADQLGCRNHEEFWEHLFEAPAPGQGWREHLSAVSAYCELARADSSEQELREDGTLQREAEMAWHILQALDERQPSQGPVLAVVGGFHAVVLPQLIASDIQRPSLPCRNIKDEFNAVVRYGFERLDQLNGYSAGMTSPAWHQKIWDAMRRKEQLKQPVTAALRYTAGLEVQLDLAATLRSTYQMAIPTPMLIAANEQMCGLAALRGRVAPIREDIVDAVTSCFIKGETDGDGALIRKVLTDQLSGQALGHVPSAAGVPPLVRDFERSAQQLRLKLGDTRPRSLVLDIYRRPAHRLTSRLLHGLALLSVPFGVRLAGPDFVKGTGLDRLLERWEYRYTPSTQAALVEASLYGTTVTEAVSSCFQIQLDTLAAQGSAIESRAAVAMLVKGCVLGLHEHLAPAMKLLRLAVTTDARFESVVDVMQTVAMLWKSREPLEATTVYELADALTMLYERAIYLGEHLPDYSNDAVPAVNALVMLRELVCSEAGRALDSDLYWSMVARLKDSHAHTLIRGASAGLLYLGELLGEEMLARELTGHLEGLSDAHSGVAYLRGVLCVAREVLWQLPVLLEVLDGLLTRWSESEFIINLPELRLALASLTPRETDRVAQAVARRHGMETLGPLVNYALDETRLQRHLELSAAVREIMSSDGLSAWVQP